MTFRGSRPAKSPLSCLLCTRPTFRSSGKRMFHGDFDSTTSAESRRIPPRGGESTEIRLICDPAKWAPVAFMDGIGKIKKPRENRNSGCCQAGIIKSARLHREHPRQSKFRPRRVGLSVPPCPRFKVSDGRISWIQGAIKYEKPSTAATCSSYSSSSSSPPPA